MKVLYLLRHAKSSWANADQTDIDRPLNPRGLDGVRRLVRHLPGLAVSPQIVLCSTARRTEETLAGIRPALDPNATVQMRTDLYLASATKILGALRGLDDATSRAMVIGHNPGLEEAARALAWQGESRARRRIFTKFPTGGLAIITASVDHWRDVGPDNTRLDAFVRPKDLD